MEKVYLPKEGSLPHPQHPWATTGKPKSRERNFITSLHMEPDKMESVNLHLQDKYRKLRKEERYELFKVKDADIILVAFGLTARVCTKVMDIANEKGLRVGVVRPITLYPFPSDIISSLATPNRIFLTVEMNSGQMLEDVRLAVNGKSPVYFRGRMGGMIPTPEDILLEVEALAEKHHLAHQEVR